MPSEVPESLVQALAQILHEHGDKVLDGSRILALLTPCLQVVTRLFEQLFPRGPGTGFQALPAHPADSVPILRAQFMLDMLQKTPSLKLVHPAECPRQFDVNIFPFKSLRSLELRCLPPHCLRGLRSVYSQLEVLTCYRCVSSLEEVIALCGGDLSSALPWLVLHTLDFSYNTLKNLDGSLELLNSLKILDLSHNQITECGSYLKVLSELQYLNLGYNHLTAVPELSVGNTAKLHSLILKHNQLSGTSGLENLPNLQHLDLSYNLLLEHSQLSGLARLHNLKQLFLEGNPLYFQKDYRALTAQHLSHKASDNVLLDGKLLSSSEIMNAQAFGEKVRLQPSSSATESSCTGDLTDSYSAAEKSAPRLPRKKSRVKVRTASISERSDSEYERRGQPIVLQHQREIERTDSFREQYGEDWLQYRPHLEGELDPEYVNRPHSPPPRASPSPTAPSSVPKQKSPVPAPEPSPSPKSGHVAPDDQLMEKAEEGLEEHLWGLQEAKKPNEEEGLIGGALCSPVVVCPVLNGQPRNPDWPWVFLRITLHFLLEMDPERGRILLKRELRSLRGIQTSLAPWKCNGEEQELPLLTLSFDSVCEEKQTVNYIVLDNSPESSVTTLLDLLRPMLERNLREKAESQDELTRMQCLKCKAEFRNEVDGGDIYSPESLQQGKEPTAGLHRNHTGDASCPSCGSLHIILAPLNPTGETSTPLRPLSAEPPQGDDGGGGLAAKSFYLSEDEDSSETDSSPNTAPSEAESTIFYSFDTEGQDQQSAQDTGRSSLTGSYKYTALNQSGALSQDGWQISPGPASTLDFRLVDHRLKLYLDMEVLNGDMEEFRCCMKVPVIRFGKVSEFWAVVAVSNQKIYFLEITGEIRDNPSDWLQPIESQSLTSLARLHVGLQEHSLHLGFGGSGGAYTLLTRNQQHCRVFHKHMLDVLAELPARYLGNIQQSSEEPITPQHRLWLFLQDKVGAPESNAPPRFLYVPLFFLREDIVSPNADSPCANANSQLPLLNTASPAALIQGAAAAAPLSLLVTRTHMYLLEEDHQWLPDTPDTELPDSVQMKEKQPISNISSVHLFQSATLHLRIHLYNETQQNESAWLLWTEDPDRTREIVEWLREPWEAEYHIHFNPVTHNT